MSSPRPTLANLSIAMARAASRSMPAPSIRPKATFSHTVRESNNAADWNSMPNLVRIRSRSAPCKSTVSSPSMRMLPRSGRARPRIHFNMTDFPVPEPPMTTTDSPLARARFNPFSTTLGPNDLCTPESSRRGVSFMANISLRKERFGHEIVRNQNQDQRRHHRIRRGPAHALGAALGVKAVITAHQGDQKTEYRRFH